MFFDRPEAGERALLVHCSFTGSFKRHSAAKRAVASGANDESGRLASTDSSVDEFVDLVRAAGISPIYLESMQRKDPSPRLLIGSGKVDELAELVKANDIDVALFNHTLSPSQERNLEKELECKVIDRTGLILDIFAQRARSHIGKLQVELAQLEHISTRLVRGWTHLERQQGGIGIRGPGESQLETDRRLLQVRITAIKRRLAKVNAQHDQGRRARSRAELPTIALVGYTNAGKSTLFNAVTSAGVLVKDQLFATLDTTMRSFDLPSFGKIILADTVGFVSDLPHQLVDAFKATLEEAAQADLLLHVIDASAVDMQGQIDAVEEVLAEIGAMDLPRIQVMNKVDLLSGAAPLNEAVDEWSDEDLRPRKIWLSAHTGAGMPELLTRIAGSLDANIWRGTLQLAAAQARLRAKLYAEGAVQSEQISDDGGYELVICHRASALQRLLEEAGISWPPGK